MNQPPPTGALSIRDLAQAHLGSALKMSHHFCYLPIFGLTKYSLQHKITINVFQ